MKIAATIARIILGLVFLGFGASVFFITTPPPLPGLAGTFNQVFYASHWALFVAAAQVLIGVLMLANRYVPVALIVLAGFLYNSFAFHITMMPSALPMPVLVTGLWLIVALKYRALFAPLFVPVPRIPDETPR